jgi:phage FluMu protein Com
MFVSHSLRNFRCSKCAALLCKQDIQSGALECKCHSCNTYSTLIVETDGVIHENKSFKTIKEETKCPIKTK